MSRYMTDIKDGEVYKKALDNYKAYLSTKADTDRRLVGGTVTKERASVLVKVNPFGGTGTITRAVKASKAGFDALKTVLTDARVSADLAGALDAGRFKPAKFNGFAAATRQSSMVKSKRTGLFYIKYGAAGDSATCPFGAKTNTEEFEDAKAEITAAFKTANSGKKYVRVSFTNEKY